jgi:AraC family transcriptional activator of pobA
MEIKQLNAQYTPNRVLYVDDICILTQVDSIFQEYANQSFYAPHYILLLIIKGSFWVTVDEKKYKIVSNSILLVAPSSAITFLSHTKECEYIMLNSSEHFIKESNFNPKHFQTFLFSTQTSSTQNMISVAQSRQIKRRCIDIQTYLSFPKDYPFIKEIIQKNFSVLFYEIGAIVTLSNEKMPSRFSRKENLVMQYMNAINKDAINKPVFHYAQLLHVSTKYLSYCVKDVIGKTAVQVLNDKILIRSKAMLNNPDYTIATIAELLNFSDQFVFSKFFRRLTGLTPSNYRRTLV